MKKKIIFKLLLTVFIVLSVFFIFGFISKIHAQGDEACCKIGQPGGPGGQFKCYSTTRVAGCDAGIYVPAPCKEVFGCPEYPLTTITTGQDQKKESPPVPPKLQIRIPGFGAFTTDESKLIKTEIDPATGTERTFYQFPWIGEYFAALFRWGTITLAIVAVIFITIAGFRWMMAAGNSSIIGKAKNQISDALFGLILILGASFILGFINPNLTVFKPIIVEKVKKIELEISSVSDSDASVVSTPVGSGTCGENLITVARQHVGTCLSPCNCANFVSIVLRESGCTFSGSTGAGPLYDTLIQSGWTEVKTTPKAGDIFFTKAKIEGWRFNHVEIFVSNGRCIGTGTSEKTMKSVCLETCPNLSSELSKDRNECLNCSAKGGALSAFSPASRKFAKGPCVSNQCVYEGGCSTKKSLESILRRPGG